MQSAGNAAKAVALNTGHIHFVHIDAAVLQHITDRAKFRAAVESLTATPFTVFALPAPIALAVHALLRDELIRRHAPMPWAVEAFPTAAASGQTAERWQDEKRQKYAALWPAPTEARAEQLVQVGSVAPMVPNGVMSAEPNERLFAGNLVCEQCIEVLDHARAEMRRLLWKMRDDIGARRQRVLAEHAALYNAFVVSADWPADKPVNAADFQRPAQKNKPGLLFGKPISFDEAQKPWTSIRESLIAGLATNVHSALADARFTEAADSRALPRVLILGESGTGKSLVVDYLARRVSDPGLRRLQRVAVPDYVGAESALKHELFGYAPGSFTGASPRGEAGLLLSNVGGVIFLDEIGDASPDLQAKLLAYLDDYRVRPVGYSGAPFPCPSLIVAATNRPVEFWAQNHRDGKASPADGHWFRHDLLERFDLIVRLPSLNERIVAGDLPAIVDSLLQTEAVNPVVDTGTGKSSRRVHAIDQAAINELATRDYGGANLRKLTRLLTSAVQRAARSGRDYMVVADLPAEQHSSQGAL